MTEDSKKQHADTPVRASDTLDHERLLKLARDKSKQGRSQLVDAIKDLYSGSENVLTASDRALASDILCRLIGDIEVSVRSALSEFFSERKTAPLDLVRALANDEIGVAYPILAKSQVLEDKDLFEVIAYQTMEHRLAIAVREYVSEGVSEALVAKDEEQVTSTLLRNTGARFSESTMGNLVDRASTTEAYQKPLIARQDLPKELAGKLYWLVSAALRQHLIAKFDLDPLALDAEFDTVISRITALGSQDQVRESIGAQDAGGGGRRSAQGASDIYSFTSLLRRGEIRQFIQAFASLTKLRTTLVRRILFEPGGEGLAIACKAAHISKPDFSTIFVFFRMGRLGQQKFEGEEVTHALTFFDKLDASEAESVLARWGTNEDYLNAIRMLEESGS